MAGGLTYTGEDWRKLINMMNARQVRNVVKRSFRAVAKVVRATAVTSLASTPINVRGNRSDWKKGIRSRIYSRGGGFSITVKGVGGKSMHKNRRGLLKPILMWAEDGTAFRRTKGKGGKRSSTRQSQYTGRMPKYGFLERAEGRMYQQVESELFPKVEQATMTVAAKAGWV